MRATKPGKVIELDRQHMLALIQSDAELGEILTRAFILRRVELVAAGMGDVVLIGSTHSADTLRIKEFLMRNGHCGCKLKCLVSVSFFNISNNI